MPGMIMNAQPEDKGQAVISPVDERHDSHDTKHDDLDADHDMDDLVDGKAKKKRRVIKTSDKKYECPQPECGKSYSRAEHLYRHQLNHSPKQIYRCDFPGCDRHFVRADLCARHKERHTAKGSHLQRKDQFLTSQRNAAQGAPNSGTTTIVTSPGDSVASLGPNLQHSDGGYVQQTNGHTYTGNADTYSLQPNNDVSSMRPANPVSLDPQLPGSYTGYPASYNPRMMPPSSPNSSRRYSNDGSMIRPSTVAGAYGHSQQMAINTMQPPPLSAPHSATTMYTHSSYNSSAAAGQAYVSPTSYPNMAYSMPNGLSNPYGMPPNGRLAQGMSSAHVSSMEPYQVPNSGSNSVVDFNVLDLSSSGYAMPVFGLPTEGLNRSPPLAMDDMLFNQLLETGTFADLNPPTPPPPEPAYLQQMQQTPLPKVEADGTTVEPNNGPETWNTSSPEIQALDLNMRESLITEGIQKRLVDLIRTFDEVESMPERKSKHAIMAGDHSDPTHALSVHMMKTYLTSYWVHIHQQMPILHRPTFNAESCPDLLLLAMLCLGACCLERTTHKPEVLDESSELSFFVAYHIRWEVFKNAEFKPTAKLWTFQAMLLLELFEKMYSTRSLHERAHIHHATTLTVMRRGSSLIGRSAVETPAGRSDPTRTPPGPDGSINTSGMNTPDAVWNRWITAEATRRVAFAAFVIDSTHATLFGHSAVMALHDLRLPLPCDEALWSATSMSEVQRVEASLAANGFKHATFLDGLKKTLAGQKVRTNTFGRVILMAGLLNVSWHLNQRDLQVSSLGANNTLGNPTRWRMPLTRAFDSWRRDFDEGVPKNDHWLQMCNLGRERASNGSGTTSSNSSTSGYIGGGEAPRDNINESRTCLHSLAHMAMHVDIVDCEVFAGADRALGRVVTDADRAVVQRRMRETWAPSARARDATFYALKFLCEVLMPDVDMSPAGLAKRASNPPPPPGKLWYNARDDYLLNRPWILYFACMIVWSYGYALDGALKPANLTLSSYELRVSDMRRYLIRVGGVKTPNDLEVVKDRNYCLGLLLLLRDVFQQPRWELLHEASEMISNCIDLLVPSAPPGIKSA